MRQNGKIYYGDEEVRGSPGGLAFIKELVDAESWDFGHHVLSHLKDGEYSEADLKHCVLTGTIHKREKDEYGEAVDGNKYTIVGQAVAGYPFYVVGKILRGEEGQYFFLITAHRAK